MTKKKILLEMLKELKELNENLDSIKNNSSNLNDCIKDGYQLNKYLNTRP